MTATSGSGWPFRHEDVSVATATIEAGSCQGIIWRDATQSAADPTATQFDEFAGEIGIR